MATPMDTLNRIVVDAIRRDLEYKLTHPPLAFQILTKKKDRS